MDDEHLKIAIGKGNMDYETFKESYLITLRRELGQEGIQFTPEDVDEEIEQQIQDKFQEYQSQSSTFETCLVCFQSTLLKKTICGHKMCGDCLKVAEKCSFCSAQLKVANKKIKQKAKEYYANKLQEHKAQLLLTNEAETDKDGEVQQKEKKKEKRPKQKRLLKPFNRPQNCSPVKNSSFQRFLIAVIM